MSYLLILRRIFHFPKNHLGGPFGILDRRRLAADQPSAYTGFR